MVNKVGSHHQWSHLDPSLELVLLETDNEGSCCVSFADQDGSKADVLRIVSSEEEEGSSTEHSNLSNSIQADESSLTFSSTSSLSASTSSSSKENLPPKINESSKETKVIIQPRGFPSFSCGFEDSCDAISLADADDDDSDTEEDDKAVRQQPHTSSSITQIFGETTFSEAFLCGSLQESNSKAPPLKALHCTASLTRARLSRAPLKALHRAVSLTRARHSLPEEHGPIRRELIAQDDDDDSVSSRRSEATTDHVSNVSFAKLASTILTSQAAKKAVAPMDRIAALLEWKGVGRGTHAIHDIRESTDLRLFVDDYSEANFWPLLDSLYFNKCLRKLVLFRNRTGDGARVRTHTEMDCLFRVLMNRPSSSTLAELHLWNFAHDDQHSLSRGLANKASLEYIQLHLETGAISSSLVKAMAALPKLISLELEVSSSFPISTLLNSKSLGILTVVCSEQVFDFDTNEILELSNKLKENRTLSVLHLGPRISPDVSLPAILEALISRNRTLETFQFSCEASTHEQGDLALQHILDTLQVNSRLRVLWNNHYESWMVSTNMRQKVLRALEKNKTIQQFHVFPEAAEYWYKKYNVLEKNMTTDTPEHEEQ